MSSATPAASTGSPPTSPDSGPPVPHSFAEFLRAFGPGIVIVLTWLGAGDIVDMGVAGSNYHYSLLWVLVAAIFMRFVFVSLIARYQLCNQHGESVLDGLVRLHRWYAPTLFVAAIVMSHVYLAYMAVGTGEVTRNVLGVGETWMWAILWNCLSFYLVFQRSFPLLERVFKTSLAVLSISFVGSAIWVGFNVGDVARGLVSFEMPGQQGPFASIVVALAMIGAVGGSLMNLVYPYFLEEKGWRGPKYLSVQRYDFMLGMIVMLFLNMSVWIVGAEVLYPDRHITKLDDLPNLLSTVLGPSGRVLFYAGIFSAVYTSSLGHVAGLSSLGSHAWLRWRSNGPVTIDYRRHPMYRGIAIWALTSPLIWTIPGMPDFVTLTLAANSGQVVLLPLLAGGIWCITASSRHIGAAYRNRWWENLIMALMFGLALYGAYHSASVMFRAAMGG